VCRLPGNSSPEYLNQLLSLIIATGATSINVGRATKAGASREFIMPPISCIAHPLKKPITVID